MYTVREMIIDAYDDAMIRAEGMTITQAEMVKGLKMTNQILGKEFQSGDFQVTTTALSVSFTGTDEYTIGPQPDLVTYPTAAIPDFELPIAPSRISMIVLIAGGNARIIASPVTGGQYYSRGVSQVQNNFPTEFFYQRSSPLGSIKFYMGTPQGPGEVVYEPVYTSAELGSDLDLWPEGLKVYLKWQVASHISAINRFDNTWLEIQAKDAYSIFKRANYKGQGQTYDASAPGSHTNVGTKFNIYTGQLV